MKESDIIKKILCIIVILITLIIPLNTKAIEQDVIQKEKKDTVEIILTGTIVLISILYIYKKKQIKL